MKRPEPRRIDYDRPGALLRDLDARPILVNDPASIRVGDMITDFTGTDTFVEARELYLEGWPKGAAEVTKINEDIERQVLNRVPTMEIQQSVTGSDIDMGAHIAGEPEDMLEWNLPEKRDMGVRIVVNLSASAGISRRVLMARGAVIVALVHALQILNIPTDLWVADACNDRQYQIFVRASQPGFELDIERVAFMVAHPSMLRRMFFAVMEREEDPAQREAIGAGSGYGAPSPVDREDADVYLEEAQSGDPRWSSSRAAVAWVLEELQRLGVELEA